MKIKRYGLITAVLLIFALVLSGCGVQDLFLLQVRQGNYRKAVEVYERTIAGNSGKEFEAQEALENYLDNAWNEYVNGRSSAAEFGSVFRCVQLINDSLWLITDMAEREETFERVQESQIHYANAVQYTENKDYPSALMEYSQVIIDDSANFWNARDKEEEVKVSYLEALRQEVANLVNAGCFDEALDLIYEAEYVLGSVPELEELRTSVISREVSESMTAAAAGGDPLEVIRAYEEALNQSGAEISLEMTKAYAEAKAAYLREVRENARRVYEAGKDYEAACAVVRTAIGEASFSSSLLAELESILQEYSSHAPIPLSSLDPVRQGEYIELGDKWTYDTTSTDVNGTVYDTDSMIYPEEDGFSLNGDVPKTEDDSAVTYMLNYQYSTFSGTIYRPYGTLSLNDWNGKYGRVIIYGDGVKLYDSGDITGNTWDPITFSIDVSGVRELRIVATGRWAESEEIGIYSRHPKVCLADLKLQK